MPLIGVDKVKESIDGLISSQNDKLKEVWVTGLKAVITETPVHFKDGGRLRNNWFLTTNSPSSRTRGKNRSGGASVASIDKMPDWVLGKKIYLTNNLPYGPVVEYGGYPNPPKYGTFTGTGFQKLSSGGYSRQAPSGMVRTNLAKMRNKL